MLGVNSLLHVIGVSFQLYSQLKKSPHDGTGVLGSSAVSMVSQTTRLDNVRGPLTHMTPERPPLPPNIISLCSSWLPKNGMQGHFSIYCRLFPSGASSNSLRNLLEYSTSVALTAELDLLVRALEFLSGQLPSANKLQPSDHSTPREMLLPVDTLLAVADALGYLQHHLQELTERQNASEHTINTTLVGLTAQLQQLTQLITTPAPTVAPPPIPMSLSPVSPPSPVPSAPSKQQTRPKLPFPQDFSSKRSSRRAFLNSCMLYLRLAPEQFTCDEEKIFWTLAFFKDGRAAK